MLAVSYQLLNYKFTESLDISSKCIIQMIRNPYIRSCFTSPKRNDQNRRRVTFGVTIASSLNFCKTINRRTTSPNNEFGICAQHVLLKLLAYFKRGYLEFPQSASHLALMRSAFGPVVHANDNTWPSLHRSVSLCFPERIVCFLSRNNGMPEKLQLQRLVSSINLCAFAFERMVLNLSKVFIQFKLPWIHIALTKIWPPIISLKYIFTYKY